MKRFDTIHKLATELDDDNEKAAQKYLITYKYFLNKLRDLIKVYEWAV